MRYGTQASGGHSRRRSLQAKPSSPGLPMASTPMTAGPGTHSGISRLRGWMPPRSLPGTSSTPRRTRRPAPCMRWMPGPAKRSGHIHSRPRVVVRMPRSLPPRLRYRMASSTSALRTTVSMPSEMGRPLNLHLSGGAERCRSRMGRPSRSPRLTMRALPIRSTGLQPSGHSMPPQRRAGLTTPSRRRMTG